LLRNDSNRIALNNTARKLLLKKLLTMAVLKQTIVYNTKTNKSYPVHPQMAKDQAWMAARGLIIQEPVKPFEVTNLDQAGSGEAKQVKSKTGK
jgi:hypothetical protein